MNNNHWYSGPPAAQARPNAQRWYLELQRVKREYKVLSDKSENEIKTLKSEVENGIKTIADQKKDLDDKTAQLDDKTEKSDSEIKTLRTELATAVETIKELLDDKNQALKDKTDELKEKTAELERVRLEIQEAGEVFESSMVSENDEADYDNEEENLPVSSEQEFLCKNVRVMVQNDPTIAALYERDKIKQQGEYSKSYGEGGLFECNRCQKSFTKLGLLQKHLSQKHDKISKFKCKFCEKKFSKLKIKEFHEKNHYCTGPKVKKKMEENPGTQIELAPALIEDYTIPKKLMEYEIEHIKSLISTHSKSDGIAPSEVEELFAREMGHHLSYKWIEELENFNLIEQKIFLKPA